MNPAMSAWVALRRRVPLQPGQSVLVLGATGNAGTMAVQVAKRLGATTVVGAGRDPGRLAALTSAGADELVALTDDDVATGRALRAAAAEVEAAWSRPERPAPGRCSCRSAPVARQIQSSRQASHRLRSARTAAIAAESDRLSATAYDVGDTR
jgi:threonine dehydrogenase-like Zn-dependent dehydrogenase